MAQFTQTSLRESVVFDYEFAQYAHALTVHADCFEWLSRAPEALAHAIVTDPPYGVKEYEVDQLARRTSGNGGVWRIPPSFDGHARAPLPRFTALSEEELNKTFPRCAPCRAAATNRGGCFASRSPRE